MSKYKNFLKLNDKGKSPAFFLKKDQNYLTRKIINSLFDFSQKYKKDTRICLHSSKKSKVQFMINVLRKKEKYSLPTMNVFLLTNDECDFYHHKKDFSVSIFEIMLILLNQFQVIIIKKIFHRR